MKALSLWQPWASLIAVRRKTIETRGWYTDYRGPLAIHAALKVSDEGKRLVEELYREHADIEFAEPDDPLRMSEKFHPGWAIPVGVVVCTARLVGCERVERLIGSTRLTTDEMRFGNYGNGRFGWLLDDIKPLAPPPAARGAQGLFELPQGWMCGAAEPDYSTEQGSLL